MATLLIEADDWVVWETKINNFINEYNSSDLSDMKVPLQLNGDEASPLINSYYGEVRFTADFGDTNYVNIRGKTNGALDDMGMYFETLEAGVLQNSLTLLSGNNFIIGLAVYDSGNDNFIGGPVSAMQGSGNFIWSTGGDVEITGDDNTILAGNDTFVVGNKNAIGGGHLHVLTGDFNAIGGGDVNVINANYATIGGGKNHNINADYSIIPGGLGNTVSGAYAFASGRNSTASGNYSFAHGDGVLASGINAIAFGLNVTSTNTASIAIGFGCDATGNSSTALGNSTLASATWSTALGRNSVASGNSSFAVGIAPTASGNASVAMGSVTSALADYSTVGGGYYNKVEALGGTISGGYSLDAGVTINHVVGRQGSIGGGSGNVVGDVLNIDHVTIGIFSTIAGGWNNLVTGSYSAIGGGAGHNVSGSSSWVGGGSGNNVSGSFSGVSSGVSNTVNGSNSLIGSGSTNLISGNYSFLGSGLGNSMTGASSFLGSGEGNTVNGLYNLITGGFSNTIGFGAQWSSIVGGNNNTNSAFGGVVGGGFNHVMTGSTGSIGGGDTNTVGGSYATIPGGTQNLASGSGSFAQGTRAKAELAGQFVISDTKFSNFSNTVDTTRVWLADQFNARFAGGYYLASGYDGSGVPTSGSKLASGSNAWAILSDKNKKGAFKEISNQNTIDKLRTMKLEQWSYSSDIDSGTDRIYVGYMAQDFHSTFNFGKDSDKLAIDTLQYDGIHASAIKGLIDIVDNLQKQLDNLKQEK